MPKIRRILFVERGPKAGVRGFLFVMPRLESFTLLDQIRNGSKRALKDRGIRICNH